jgi:hypothetical protein
VKFTNPHERIDRISLAMDRLVAEKIRASPHLVEIAKANLRRWMQQDEGFVHRVHAEWEEILDMLTPFELADFIASETPKANRLRQSTPFTGILSEAERSAILHQYEETAV